jgi:hypothetical protein
MVTDCQCMLASATVPKTIREINIRVGVEHAWAELVTPFNRSYALRWVKHHWVHECTAWVHECTVWVHGGTQLESGCMYS